MSRTRNMLRRAATRPATEVLKLADAALFNLIIGNGNGDAHAKNFSLLCSENGHVQLAPLYDLVATYAWPELAPKLAMRFGKAARLEEVDKETFALFAAEAKLGGSYLRIRAAELAVKINLMIAGEFEVPGLEDINLVEVVAASIGNRAERLRMKAGGSSGSEKISRESEFRYSDAVSAKLSFQPKYPHIAINRLSATSAETIHFSTRPIS